MVIWLRLNPYAIINLDISVLILYINYMSFWLHSTTRVCKQVHHLLCYFIVAFFYLFRRRLCPIHVCWWWRIPVTSEAWAHLKRTSSYTMEYLDWTFMPDRGNSGPFNARQHIPGQMTGQAIKCCIVIDKQSFLIIFFRSIVLTSCFNLDWKLLFLLEVGHVLWFVILFYVANI